VSQHRKLLIEQFIKLLVAAAISLELLTYQKKDAPFVYSITVLADQHGNRKRRVAI
jgi:hypothetical protein